MLNGPPRRQRSERISAGLRETEGVIQRPDGLRYLSPARAEAFLGLVRAGNVLASDLSDELETEHGISLRAFEILLFLAIFSDHGELSMTQLTEEAPLSQSRVSRLVAELESRGLVERRPATKDGRGVIVKITRKGVAKFRAAQNTHLAGLDERLFSRLTPAEIRQLARLTAKILNP